ncbi:MAG: DUF167 domain-containing protein [Verrucomicrobiales bacterium]|nr:DUF167 domain-containing protein [Verrucomicrobiales bacterium]MCP5528350.1 DUF167 domain-containing protein [Verrucomicrobiales bacterium]
MTPAWLTETPGGVVLTVHVQPRASRSEVAEATGVRCRLRVAAPPVDNAANEAVVRFLADLCGRPRSAIRLVRGRASKSKTIAIQGVKSSDLLAKLGFVS